MTIIFQRINFKNSGNFARQSAAALALTVCTAQLFLSPSALAGTGPGPACQARSGAQTTALLELFTSEGCDSCPPAEKWLSGVKSDASVIALAWHVDYWDRLGWKDRFAHPYATTRQRTISALEGSRNIYTPQTMVHSRSIYFTEGAAVKAHLAQTVARKSSAALGLQAQLASNKTVAVTLSATALEPNARGFVALVEDGLVSQVTSGENRGVTLRHDHVVRQFAGPFDAQASGGLSQTVVLPVPPDSNPARLSVVAWVETARGQALQSVKVESLIACGAAPK